ncbi:hypothetical protein ATY35_19955 [Vibrio cidicii]|uniref:Uncharacterized protein n=1 Tax=Vibrio cidicii TaxID=1763883 RepID=A0ABR5W080_9VIBR|nr:MULTISPECIES: hypothetical protein [Vibrio]EJL6401048.1 hypothetical protein [Vibrio navarrensis]EJL6568413.1 hypothetical protein [Vibrio navarrensis]KYN81365.1 hypothetical protein ATY35_19955 [Vibrio cidicii]
MNIARQKGNVAGFILPLIVVGSAFAYLFSSYACVIPAGGPVPYVFVSLFIFPIATIWPLLKDLTELQEISSITPTERRRLAAMVLEIQRYLKVSAFLLLIFGGTTGVVLYLVVINFLKAKLALSLIGFFVGSALCIFVFLFNMRVKIQNYKAKLASRVEELKQSQKLLKRFNKKDD